MLHAGKRAERKRKTLGLTIDAQLLCVINWRGCSLIARHAAVITIMMHVELLDQQGERKFVHSSQRHCTVEWHLL